MRRFPLAMILAAVLPAARSAAQEQLPLSLIDCYRLDRLLVSPADEPAGFFDDENLLVYAAAGEGEQPIWWLEDLSSGQRTEFASAFRSAFEGLPGVRSESVVEHFAEEDAFRWTADHSAFVTNFGNDLFYCTRDGDLRRLTHDPELEVGEDISPDGSMVAFVRGQDLYLVDVDGGEVRRLTEGGDEELLYGRLDWVYQEEVYGRGNFKGFWWSPDSTRLALLRLDESPVREFTLVSDTPVRPTVEVTNYPKAGDPNPVATLGIVDALGGEVDWIDLPALELIDTLIVWVNWHPSGGEVFFQVTDRAQTWMQMIAADLDEALARVVFEERSDCWFEPKSEPVWIKDGEEFLWVSERDGFAHLYRYRNDGAMVGRLTEGEFDVEDLLAVDEADGQVLFLSDHGNFTQRNLFRVSLAGGEPERITSVDGWHDVTIAPGNESFLDRHSQLIAPEDWTVRSVRDGSEIRRLRSAREIPFDRLGVQPPEWVQIPAEDGFVMEGYILRPEGFDPAKKAPVLCHHYAGPHAPKALDRWRSRDFLWHVRQARKGYVVFVVDPRSASGKGRRSACAAWRQLGRTELSDMEDAVDWLVAQGGIDEERIGLWGWSYGGYQTLFNLVNSRRWGLGVAVNPVTDWRFYDTIYTERYMGLPQENAAGYAGSSVLESAENLEGELLLVHATMDDNVHMQNSMSFVHALQMAQKQFQFLPYPRVRHGIGDIRQQVHLFTAIENFLDERFDGGAAR